MTKLQRVAQLLDSLGFDESSEAVTQLQADLIATQKEIERLTSCLHKANSNHEEFERKYYLELDRAEQALALRGEPVATNRILFVSDPFCPCCGHNRDTSSVSSIDLGGTEHECQICRANWAEIDPLTPLYAAPISGETAQHQISTQRALTEQAWNRQKKDQDDINDLLTRLGLSEDQFRTDGYWLNVPKILTLLREKAVSGERVREACAKVCDDIGADLIEQARISEAANPGTTLLGYRQLTAELCATAIRALPLAAQPEGK